MHSVSSPTQTQSSRALPNGTLVIRPRELNITFEPLQKENRCHFKIQLKFIPTFAQLPLGLDPLSQSISILRFVKICL